MKFAKEYLGLGVIGGVAPLSVEVDGALLNAQASLQLINTLNTAGANATGVMNFQTSAASTITLTNLGALTQRLTIGSACTVTIDSAYNIVNNIASPFLGQQFSFDIVTNASTTVATPTLSDTAVTLAGTTSVLGAALRRYAVTITQLNTTAGIATTAGTTFTSLTQVGSTNNYTVALGTNAISPTVGQLIFLNVTAGTLPSGWYPINKVTSATSFVIAAPTVGTAWTATAATVGTSTVAPLTYSPTLTITGAWATVTGTTSV